MISIKKNLPVILIEYNKENFFEIYKLLKKIYNSYLYDINLNKLIMLNKKQIKSLINGKMKKNFYLGQRNIFFYLNYKNDNFNIFNIFVFICNFWIW